MWTGMWLDCCCTKRVCLHFQIQVQMKFLQHRREANQLEALHNVLHNHDTVARGEGLQSLYLVGKIFSCDICH